MSPQRVLKSSGDTQTFSRQKLVRSLRRAGVSRAQSDIVVKDIMKNRRMMSTEDIHAHVYAQLKKIERPLAAKYNLKRALAQLGPSGYPFEQFVGRLLEAKGYQVSTNRMVQGACVSHEVDILGTKDDKHFIFECKFHNRAGFKSDIQTVLYMKARYDDIRAQWEQRENGRSVHVHKVWIVTNTAFTSEARRYARCAGMGLMSWRSPVGHTLVELIEETGLHPITAVTSLTHKQKTYIVSHGLVVCRDAKRKQHVLEDAGIHGKKRERVLAEAAAICGCDMTS